MAHRHAARGRPRPVRDRRGRLAGRAVAARYPRHRALRRPGHALSALGRDLVPGAAAGCGDRHRRVRYPDRPGHPAAGRAPDGVPAQRRLRGAAHRQAGRALAERGVPARARGAERLAGGHVLDAGTAGLRLRQAALDPEEGRGCLEDHLERAVADPGKRQKLTPHYDLGCKRVLPSNDFYPAVAAANVDLVTEKIIEFTPDGIVTADGRTHLVDTVVLATGFRVTDSPMFGKITGRDGRTLADAFGQTYLGTVVPGFPNYFQLSGANTGLGHSSIVFMIQSQLAYVLDAVRAIDAVGGGPAEVRPQIAAVCNAELQRKLPATVWGSGCASWYLDSEGRNVTLWPGFTISGGAPGASARPTSSSAAQRTELRGFRRRVCQDRN